MAQQLRLTLRRALSCRAEDFVAGPSNDLAREALDSWPRWHGGALSLFGPEGVGKSHLAQLWRQRVGAATLDRADPDLALAAKGPVLVEDVDRGISGEALFHLINLAAREGCGLLLTARTPPAAWPADLPDLRSRLNAMFTAEIEPPDDLVLEAVLKRLFEERSIRPTKDVYPYLLRRMERSVPQARAIVQRLDEASDESGRPISRALSRQIFEDPSDNLDLFE